jgi:PAS domain S-box-containing protein
VLIGLAFMLRLRSHSLEREKLRLESQRSQSDFEALFASSTQAYILLSPRLVTLRVNDAARQLVRRVRNEDIRVGQSILAFGKPKHAEEFVERAARVMQGEHIHFQREIDGVDGKKYWAEYFLQPVVQDGKVTGLCESIIDVTERKQIELELERSKMRYEALLSSLDDVAVYESGNRHFISPNLPRMLGYTEEEFRGFDGRFQELVHGEDDDLYNKERQAWAANGYAGVLHTIMRCRHKNGEWVWLRDRMVRLAPEGEEPYFAGIMMDVTAVRKAQDALRENEELYRQMFERSPAIKWLLDPGTGQIYDANPAAASFYGYSIERLKTMRISEIYTMPEQQMLALLRETAAGEGSHYEFPHRLANGEIRQMDIHTGPIEIRGRLLLHSILVDVTKRREAQEALRKSDERYRAFVSQSAEGIWRIEVDEPVDTAWSEDEQIEALYAFGRLAECNDVFARMYGARSAQDMLGVSLGQMLLREDPRNEEYLRSFIRGGYRVADAVSVERTIDGQERIFLNNLFGVIEGGRVVRAWGTQRDITDQHHAQQALKESEQRYRELIDNMIEGMTLIDAEGVCQVCNPAIEEILGVGPGELVGRRVFDFAAPEYVGYLTAQWEQLRAGQSGSFEIEIVRPNGSRRVVFMSAKPRMNEAGEFCGSYAVCQDITDSRHAQQELERSQVRYSTLLQNLDDVVVYELGPKRRWMSENLSRILGYTAEEFAEYEGNFSRLMHPLDHEHYQQAEQEWLAQGAPGMLRMELRMRNKQGNWIWFEDRIVVLNPGGEEPYRTGVMIDINSRKQAEIAVKVSEEQYREVVEGSSDLILQLAGDYRISYLNPMAALVMGARSGDLADKLFANLIGKDEFGTLLGNFEAAVSLRRPSYLAETEIHGADGNTYTYLWTASMKYHPDGSLASISAIGHDMTRQRQREGQILQQQKEESIITLAGGIAHDFNNILTGVLGASSLLQESVPKDSSDAELVGAIITSARQMADLTQKLLVYARGGRFEPRPANLNDIVSDTLAMLRATLATSDEVVTDLAPDLWLVEGDPGQLNQVLLNLAVNAHEAMHPLGGRLSIRTFNTSMGEGWSCSRHVRHEPGDYVCLEVADTGKGMDSATIQRIFDPFFSTKFQGRGLGLAASAGVVANHHGCMTAHSAVGQGSTFRVLIPRQSEASPVPRPVPEVQAKLPRPAEGYSGLVLVVDDEMVVRDTTSAILRRAGYEVLTAGDGLEGLGILRRSERPIDLLIVDLLMPRMGGEGVIAGLRDLPVKPVVLVSSGYDHGFNAPGEDGSDSTASQLAALGGCEIGFIQKPFTSEYLLSLANQMLSLKADRLENQAATSQ